MKDITTTSIAEGINLHYIPDKKYKTVSVSTYLNRKLCREEVTKNALLAKLLTRGTQKCKNMFELGVYADELYGTLFDVNITKKASVQSIVSSVNFLNDEYTGENISGFAVFTAALHNRCNSPVPGCHPGRRESVPAPSGTRERADPRTHGR